MHSTHWVHELTNQIAVYSTTVYSNGSLGPQLSWPIRLLYLLLLYSNVIGSTSWPIRLLCLVLLYSNAHCYDMQANVSMHKTLEPLMARTSNYGAALAVTTKSGRTTLQMVQFEGNRPDSAWMWGQRSLAWLHPGVAMPTVTTLWSLRPGPRTSWEDWPSQRR